MDVIKNGLVPDGQVLDIREIDLVSAKMLEDPGPATPVFIIRCQAQEMLVYRNPKTDEVVHGVENRIEQVGYVLIMTRVAEDMADETTGGWRIAQVRTFIRVMACLV